MNRLTAALAVIGAAGAVITATPAIAMASPAPHYYANDVAGTGRFGPAISGTAQQIIATGVARYHRDPAEFEQAAQFAHYPLPGGTKWLIRHPGRWNTLANGFGGYLRSTIREEVRWTSPYRTEYAVPHGSKPTTFGWTTMPDLTRTVEVFTWGDLVANCGLQMYIPAKPIPLPAAAGCTTKGKHKVVTCSVCAPGTKLFHVPGIGRMCLCPQTVHVIVSQTRTVAVTVITKVTTTTSTTTTVSYGKCPKKHKCKIKS